jgi:asparagine synthase (glutamine-hydrolysing)
MTGLAGAVALDRDRAVPREIAARLAGSIRHRGMARQSDWSEGNAWLGHADGGTTTHRGANLGTNSDGARVVADIRLDNRVELGRALGLRDLMAVSDVDLLLLSYGRWGEHCCSRLIGDFAFAIWDGSTQTLFCGRDQLGVRPFYYCRRDGMLLFGSEVSGIVDGAPLNEERIAGFILGLADDASSTAFSGVSRLPPGSWLRLADGQLCIERYWAPEAEDRVEPVDAVGEFRAAFIGAVEARADGVEALGAMLSGGLDSSSIVSVAAGGPAPLQTYSFSYPKTPGLSERCFIDAVTGRHDVRPTFIDFDDLAPLRGMSGLADGRSDLFFGPGLPKMSMLFAAAHAQGSRVLLDGHGGDEVVSHGYGRLRELAQEGHWLALYRALRGVSGTFGENPNALFMRYLLTFSPLRRLVRQRRATPAMGAGDLDFLNPELARRTGVTERYRAWQERQRLAGRSERSQQLWNVAAPGVAESFEALDRAASRAGVELRFPFFDLRLVSLMLAVPASQKLRDGWSRSILRRGMDGILPPKVQWRRDKIDFSSEISRGLVRHHRAELEAVMADDDGVGAYFDLGRLRQSVSALLAAPDRTAGPELFMIWRSLMLMHWLRNRSA